jgi:hypothetical protein
MQGVDSMQASTATLHRASLELISDRKKDISYRFRSLDNQVVL